MKNVLCIMMICIWSCGDSNKQSISDLSEDPFKSIELIDTFTNDLEFDVATSVTTAEFHPMYMGIGKDSIHLNYWPGEIEYLSFSWDEFRTPDSNDLKIHVDTSQIIDSVNRRAIPPPPPPPNSEEEAKPWERKLNRGKIKSYPIIMKNVSEDTLSVGYREYIPLIIEAKDSSGNWRPIQEPYRYYCGTGLPNYHLPPKEIVIASCKLFEGDYETEMRITFGFDRVIKSNEFKGQINYKQFDQSEPNYY